MRIDFTELNVLCPKDPYHLSNIDSLIDGSSHYCMLSFIDVYSGYNQIKIDLFDMPKTVFISRSANYYYNVIPFGLKNAGATYQRLMDVVSFHQIGRDLEV